MEKYINNFKMMVSVFSKINDVIGLLSKGFDYIFSLNMLNKIIGIFIPDDIDISKD